MLKELSKQEDRFSHDTLKWMPTGYWPILFFCIIALLFPIGGLFAGRLLRPFRPTRVKLEAYECGIPPASTARGRYPVRYYLVAMLFVIFDVETIFLFPWAVRYHQLGWFGVAEISVFLAFLVVGYIWIFKKRALEWH